MSEQIIITLILAGQAILVTLLGLVGGSLNKVRRDVKNVKATASAALDQVANNHVDEDGNPINLREENDTRHMEIMHTLAVQSRDVERTMREVRRDIGGLRQEARNDRQIHHDHLQETRKNISDLQLEVGGVTKSINTLKLVVAHALPKEELEMKEKDNEHESE